MKINLAELNAKIDAEPLPQSLNCALKETISKWPDFEFTTPEGRRFCYAADGESIFHRIRASSYLTKKQTEWLTFTVAGVILDSEDELIVFGDSAALETAWLEWHDAYNVPFTEDEREMFGVDADDPEDSDEL